MFQNIIINIAIGTNTNVQISKFTFNAGQI